MGDTTVVRVFAGGTRPHQEMMPTNVKDLIAWLNAKLATVPAAFQDTCELVTIPHSCDEDAAISVVISYERPK